MHGIDILCKNDICKQTIHANKTQKTIEKFMNTYVILVYNLMYYLFLKFFYWSTVDLQCCVSFSYTAK